MLNQLFVVGRLTAKAELKETDDKKEYANITIAVPRSFKNKNGEYETDFINCVLFDRVAKNTVQYCNKGDLLGVKGRLQNTNNKLSVVAERVNFLSSMSKKDDITEEKEIKV
ncbi:MAG: single-stranded DNA-binding protein [Bacilli bacterium]|nr:single-stranded DNA-binding protein [Bacilli bacterium]